MALPSLSGPFNLSKDGINSAVKSTLPGYYALGYVSANTFYIQRVGRSDADLNKRLHDYEGQYLQFKCGYAASQYQAFLAECELWHEYGNRTTNPLHPDRPNGTDWKCPRCKNFG